MTRLLFALIAGLGVFAAAFGSPAAAAGRDAAVLPLGWNAGSVRIEEGRADPVPTQPGERRLTVRRPAYRDDADVFDDGATRYNDIRSFNPAPAITSGTQLPFGLDGIGGYGRDLGFDDNASVYLR